MEIFSGLGDIALAEGKVKESALVIVEELGEGEVIKSQLYRDLGESIVGGIQVLVSETPVEVMGNDGNLGLGAGPASNCGEIGYVTESEDVGVFLVLESFWVDLGVFSEA